MLGIVPPLDRALSATVKPSDGNLIVAPNKAMNAVRFMSESKPKARRTAEQTRQHVLDVARELFYWNGIRATGVDRVAAEAGIAPTALYRLFPSKDALVAAYVQRTEQRYREWFEAASSEDGRSAAERIDALFAALAEQTRPDVCRGCPFMMALTEFPDQEVEGHHHAVRLKKWVRARIRKLASEHASEHPRKPIDSAALADHLMLLFEGVYATVQALGHDGPAKRARQLAAMLTTP
jgi:AcrR family transcriptional regulator